MMRHRRLYPAEIVSILLEKQGVGKKWLEGWYKKFLAKTEKKFITDSAFDVKTLDGLLKQECAATNSATTGATDSATTGANMSAATGASRKKGQQANTAETPARRVTKENPLEGTPWGPGNHTAVTGKDDDHVRAMVTQMHEEAEKEKLARLEKAKLAKNNGTKPWDETLDDEVTNEIENSDLSQLVGGLGL
jgi:hypothetical protein